MKLIFRKRLSQHEWCIVLIAMPNLFTGCLGEKPPETAISKELRIAACEAEADAYKILRGKRECLAQGVPFAGCAKEQDIKAEHRERLTLCQE